VDWVCIGENWCVMLVADLGHIPVTFMNTSLCAVASIILKE